MQGRLLWDSDFTQKAQDSTVYLKIRPYYFYLVQALQSSTHYLKWRVLFSVLPFLYLSQMRRKEVSTREKMVCESLLHVDVKFIFGSINLHRASISPTMGGAVFPAHLPLPSQSKLTFIFKSSPCSKSV